MLSVTSVPQAGGRKRWNFFSLKSFDKRVQPWLYILALYLQQFEKRKEIYLHGLVSFSVKKYISFIKETLLQTL